MCQDVVFKIDIGGDFCQYWFFWVQFENCLFGDVMYGLFFGVGQFVVVRNLVYFGDEFMYFVFVVDMQCFVFIGDFQFFGGKRGVEYDVVGILGDIDKIVCVGVGCVELCGIDVFVWVYFVGVYKGDVDFCVVVVEYLILVVNYCVQIMVDIEIYVICLLFVVDF